MSQLIFSPTMDDIRHVAARIAERFRPNKIILFGSHAYGTPTDDSDVDLLVVMETPLRNPLQATEIRSAVGLPFAADLLVRKPQELEERLAMGDPFLQDVVTNGIVLYEGDNPRVD